MQIIRAQPGDAATLTEIALAAKRHWEYPERWMQLWLKSLSIQPEFIKSNETHLAVEAGRAVGFHALTGKTSQLRLEHLWVVPEAMGRGVGRALFLHAVALAQKLGGEQLEIESDPNAAGFYQRMGAQPDRVRITQIDGQRRELPVFIHHLNRGPVTIPPTGSSKTG